MNRTWGRRTIMTEFEASQINQLVADKHYAEAKALLRKSTDPSAKSWLASLEKRFPAPDAPFAHYKNRDTSQSQYLNENDYSYENPARKLPILIVIPVLIIGWFLG